MNWVLKKDAKYTFCPGCDHGVAIRLVAEVLEEMGSKKMKLFQSHQSVVQLQYMIF